MRITLTDSRGHKFASCASWEAANVAAKAIFKRQCWSDLYYLIETDELTVNGSIDLEPKSFHKPHQHKIFTWHLKTFWGNVARSSPSGILSQSDIDFAAEVVAILPTMPTSINTLEDVYEFFTHLYTKELLAFHPDDFFEDYIDMESNAPSYTPEEAAIRNKLMGQCFTVCTKANADIYSIGVALYHKYSSQNIPA